MNRIQPEDVNGLTDIVVNLPQFKDLNNRDNIKEVFKEFLQDLYNNQPKELFDVFDFKLSTRMQETFFANYGIDKKYSRKLKGHVKKDIGYHLESLFQNKGSKLIFKQFNQIFENIFRNINFYNVEVYKIPSPDGFRFEYRLDPIYITDRSQLLKKPQIDIQKTRKYLMDLQNFKDYKIWPVPTNLVYIQLSIGSEIINNTDVFLNGIRSYATTYLTNFFFKYKDTSNNYENIHMADAEFIIKFFSRAYLHMKDIQGRDDFPGVSSYLPNTTDSGLTKNEFLCGMQSLLYDYQDSNYANRKEMEVLRRRWQFFLRKQELVASSCTLSSYDDLNSEMMTKYPRLHHDIIHVIGTAIDGDSSKDEELFTFILELYSSFISGAYINQIVPGDICGPINNPRSSLNFNWIIDYLDVIFSQVFSNNLFINQYFNPVLDLFIRYFFPVEMEYINDLIKRVNIKDKWNSISTDNYQKFILHSKHGSVVTPIRGLDYIKYHITLAPKYDILWRASIPRTITINYIYDKVETTDDYKATIIPGPKEDHIEIEDTYEVTIINGDGDHLTVTSTTYTP